VEILHALIADRVRGTPSPDLLRSRPSLRQAAPTSIAHLALAKRSTRVRGDALGSTPRHNGQIVRSASHLEVSAIPELKQRLRSPLAVAALVRGAGETHPGCGEGGLDAGGAAGLDGGRVAHLEHFEGRGDLVEAEGLAVGAVVVDGELEGRVVAGGEGAAGGVMVVVVGVRERVGDCLGEGGEGGRGKGEGVHCDAWVGCLVERVSWGCDCCGVYCCCC